MKATNYILPMRLPVFLEDKLTAWQQHLLQELIPHSSDGLILSDGEVFQHGVVSHI